MGDINYNMDKNGHSKTGGLQSFAVTRWKPHTRDHFKMRRSDQTKQHRSSTWTPEYDIKFSEKADSHDNGMVRMAQEVVHRATVEAIFLGSANGRL